LSQFPSVNDRKHAFLKLQTEKGKSASTQIFTIAGGPNDKSKVIEISAPAGKNVRGFVKRAGVHENVSTKLVQ
jgi:hypothetical protein